MCMYICVYIPTCMGNVEVHDIWPQISVDLVLRDRQGRLANNHRTIRHRLGRDSYDQSSGRAPNMHAILILVPEIQADTRWRT